MKKRPCRFATMTWVFNSGFPEESHLQPDGHPFRSGCFNDSKSLGLEITISIHQKKIIVFGVPHTKCSWGRGEKRSNLLFLKLIWSSHRIMDSLFSRAFAVSSLEDSHQKFAFLIGLLTAEAPWFGQCRICFPPWNNWSSDGSLGPPPVCVG